QGGLAAPIGAQQSHPLAGVHLKGEAVQYFFPNLELLDQVGNGNVDHSVLVCLCDPSRAGRVCYSSGASSSSRWVSASSFMPREAFTSTVLSGSRTWGSRASASSRLSQAWTSGTPAVSAPRASSRDCSPTATRQWMPARPRHSPTS